jgi:membrane fusion protein (multidrug efflux system)
MSEANDRPRWRRGLKGSAILVAATLGMGVALAAWKSASIDASNAAAASQPEPAESVAVAIAREHEHRRSTTSIGTVVALRSITVRNELPGTVRHTRLSPGQIVAAGTVLVALDVSVERAELQALEAQRNLAETQLQRAQRMHEQRAGSQMELDRARAERDVAIAQIARTQAIIARKTIRAPFRARIGISDVHEGQYLNEGTELTTLQGVDDAVYVDFTVAQQVAAGLRQGSNVDVFAGDGSAPIAAEVLAIDARVDPSTRNAMVRARIVHASADATAAPSPGASVRVQVPVGTPRKAVVIPASALRKGPAGDHVFLLAEDKDGKPRAYLRQVAVDALAGDDVVISSGLQPGDRVAASGSFKLREAALVALIEPTAPAARAGGK